LVEITKSIIEQTFPPLPFEEWEETKNTLHLFIQIVGKIRLAMMPRKNHWWNLTLYINSKGIGTYAMPYGNNQIFEINFDFIDHKLIIHTCNGDIREFKLENGLCVAKFYDKLFSAMKELGINPIISVSKISIDKTIGF
jgi:hypothetical protein